MFKIEVEITWKMLQTGVSQACYVSVLICSDGSVNSIFRFGRINRINMLKLYLNSLYCYRESKPSGDEDECHIDRVVVNEEGEDDGDIELAELVNQYMTPNALEFKAISAGDQYRCND
jgi:3-dehydroquinate synthase class II